MILIKLAFLILGIGPAPLPADCVSGAAGEGAGGPPGFALAGPDNATPVAALRPAGGAAETRDMAAAARAD